MNPNLKTRLIIAFLALILSFGMGDAQTSIPNGDFEVWTTPPLAAYQEPGGGWFTTLNTLASLGGPVTVEKSTDAHSGSYSAMLTTRTWGTLTIPGLVVTGEFDFQNPRFLIQGKPFTDQPNAFHGWYKFLPIGSDSAGIAALLTRWNVGAMRRDTLAIAALSVVTAASAWTSFDLPFYYLQTGVSPDTIIMALVSSGDGQNFNGQTGSTLWVDDLSLEYATATPNPQSSILEPRFRQYGKGLVVEVPANSKISAITLYDCNGQILGMHRLHAGTQEISIGFVSGIYFLDFSSQNQIVSRHKFIYLAP